MRVDKNRAAPVPDWFTTTVQSAACPTRSYTAPTGGGLAWRSSLTGAAVRALSSCRCPTPHGRRPRRRRRAPVQLSCDTIMARMDLARAQFPVHRKVSRSDPSSRCRPHRSELGANRPPPPSSTPVRAPPNGTLVPGTVMTVGAGRGVPHRWRAPAGTNQHARARRAVASLPLVRNGGCACPPD